MKLSLRGDYALRALIVLAENYGRGIVRIQTISEQQDIPKRFLEQILNDVKSGGFVESRRGIAGGYQLARPPEQITLATLIRYVEGALVALPPDTEIRKGGRPDSNQLAIRSVMQEVRESILKVLEHITLADLAERARKYRHDDASLDYVI
ncbi:MAG: Rrf2 family transcriptional regulator [Verrucomicrobia bacterium]|nr:Rrf2 family transcriptional regulator [Verrucomicrobiota bacterium]